MKGTATAWGRNERFVAAPGARVGKFVLVRELGTGGMGRVFEARHVKLGKRVAIKLLHRVLTASPKATRRFRREGRACSRIRHPHVVQMLDTGVHDGQPYLVMELVEGVDLATWLREKECLEPSELADIFLPICSALWAVHQSGVVHRDLKPSNVILTRSRPHKLHPVLVDFGIAKLSFSDTTGDVTNTESTVGTVAYMAPEQTRNARAADPTADQYALGVMLYECATGRRPFQGESQYDLMHAILHAEVTPPSAHRAALGQEFDALVLRALHRTPSERFPSVHALGAALLALASAPAWADWGPEFSGTGALRGGTEADSPRQAPGASESPQALMNWESAAPARARARMSRLLKMVATVTVLVGIGLLIHATWWKPVGDSPLRRESGLGPAMRDSSPPKPTPQPIAVAPHRVTANRAELPAAVERERAVRQAGNRRSGETKGRSSSASAPSAQPRATVPERGTNGALILE
jgi:tRNA A-37 threonylcarbamoyl transferase component Bud32